MQNFPDTASKAIAALEDAGLIETVRKGNFRQHERHASEFRLLWLKCDETGVRPRPAYRDER